MNKKRLANIPEPAIGQPCVKTMTARSTPKKADWKKTAVPALMLASILCASAAAHAGAPNAAQDVLYQVSTSNAIVIGAYDGVTSSGELKRHGNFGIAAADALGGEMMLVDSVWYRVMPDGAVQVADDALTIPFGMVAYFQPTIRFDVDSSTTYQALRAEVERHLPSRNVFYAVKLEGRFASMKNRTFPTQSKPYRNQAVVTDEQIIFETKDTEGTLLGFWFPDYIYGINLPGLHLHYLSKDKQHGGHTLDFTATAATVSIQPLYGYEIALAHTADFLGADLKSDKTAEIKKVQGR